MITDRNICIFRGTIGRIETRVASSGVNVTKASLSISNGKDKSTGEWRDKTWVNLVAFDQAALAMERIPDKAQVIVTCSYSPKGYETKNGDKRTAHDFIVNSIFEVVKAEWRGDNSGRGKTSRAASDPVYDDNYGPDDSEDIPF
jgi:single-stranded DNA-binding protein